MLHDATWRWLVPQIQGAAGRACPGATVESSSLTGRDSCAALSEILALGAIARAARWSIPRRTLNYCGIVDLEAFFSSCRTLRWALSRDSRFRGAGNDFGAFYPQDVYSTEEFVWVRHAPGSRS